MEPSFQVSPAPDLEVILRQFPGFQQRHAQLLSGLWLISFLHVYGGYANVECT